MISDKIQAQAEKLFPQTTPGFMAKRKTWRDGVRWAQEQTNSAASKAASNEIIETGFKAINSHVRKDMDRITKLNEALTHIQIMCGNPDPAAGCRNILKRATEAGDELLESYNNG